MWMEQQGILLQIKLPKPKVYFVYSGDWEVLSWSERTADTPQTLFRGCPKKYIALQTRLGAMRYQVSHLCIFSYDGTDRIRFTGQGYKAQSQPDASGSPKMDLFCD